MKSFLIVLLGMGLVACDTVSAGSATSTTETYKISISRTHSYLNLVSKVNQAQEELQNFIKGEETNCVQGKTLKLATGQEAGLQMGQNGVLTCQIKPPAPKPQTPPVATPPANPAK
jgi:hypothetical protein